MSPLQNLQKIKIYISSCISSRNHIHETTRQPHCVKRTRKDGRSFNVLIRRLGRALRHTEAASLLFTLRQTSTKRMTCFCQKVLTHVVNPEIKMQYTHCIPQIQDGFHATPESAADGVCHPERCRAKFTFVFQDVFQQNCKISQISQQYILLKHIKIHHHCHTLCFVRVQ